MSWEQIFESNNPRPVDFAKATYDLNKDEIDRIAAQHGYRLRGVRLQRVVFTSKPNTPVA